MCVGHGIGADEVSGRRGAANFELIRLGAFEVVDFVAIAIDEHRSGGSHDCRTAIASVKFHALAALAFPRKHRVFIFKAGYERVVKLPVVLEVISAA
jgi:hypothetical protein